MNYKTTNCVALLLVLLSAAGCSTAVTRRPGLSSATPPIPTLVEEQPTQSQLPKSKLQITYVQETNAGFDGMYAVDVTCQTERKLCFSDPQLLFQTFSSVDGDLNKPTGSISSYDWSPDGNKIAVSVSGDIFIGNMNTQEWINITNSIELDEGKPIWSSDGKYIYYLSCSHELGYGYCRLARIMPTGEGKIELLNVVDKSIDYFTISPDDQIVVFSMSNDGFHHLYQSNLDGSKIRTITTTNSEEISPSFSMDGTRLALVRTNGPTLVASSMKIADIIIKDINSGDEKNITEEFEDEAFSPVFSPEGNWIVLNSYDEKLTSNIFVVSNDGEDVIQVTQGIIDKGAPSWRLMRNQ